MDTSKLHNPQVAPAVFVGTHILVGREDLREIGEAPMDLQNFAPADDSIQRDRERAQQEQQTPEQTPRR
jgi:hypothetical protein